MPITELVVYRDSEYPSVWIDDKAGHPDKIASFLKSKGLRLLNAEQLRKFMIDAIERENAYDKLVIFSQDVIPDTVAEDYFANTTFREYLDAGGSVLWVGDIRARYNETYPESGFFRIWDYGPRLITDAMLKELYEVMNSISA